MWQNEQIPIQIYESQTLITPKQKSELCSTFINRTLAKLNKFSIQLPNIQHIHKSQSSFRISRKSLLNEKSEEQRSPLMLYDSFLHYPLLQLHDNTTQKLLAETALKNKPFRPSVFHSYDGPSPFVLKAQKLITERPPESDNLQIQKSNSAILKFYVISLLGLLNNFYALQK